MPINYYIESTDGTLAFSLAQGEKDGYGGTQRNTDLTLNGFGVLQWGENVNEDILRVMESHACPRKEFGDFNPATDAYDYNPLTDPVLPKSEEDAGMGPGKGINVPIIGQLWYDKTTEHVFIYSAGDLWRLAGSNAVSSPLPPPDPDSGDIWYDITGPQLMIWNDNTMMWESVADLYVQQSGDTMTGFLTLSAKPVDPLHAATKSYVDEDAPYVFRAGDTMTGLLELSGKPVVPLGAATKSYVDEDAPYVFRAGDTMTGDLTIIDDGLTDPNFNYLTYDPDTKSLTIVSLDVSPLLQLWTLVGTLDAPILRMGNNLYGGALEATAPPNIEMYNNQNAAGGPSATGWPVVRFVPRDNYVLNLEADVSFATNGGPTGTGHNVLGIHDGGISQSIMEFAGLPTAAVGSGVVRTPNATVTDILNNLKNLATYEFVDAYVGAYGGYQVSVRSGTIAHGGTIPLPSGYTEAQCDWHVGAGYWPAFGGYGYDGIDIFVCRNLAGFFGSRVVECYTRNGPTFYGTANYIIVGVK